MSKPALGLFWPMPADGYNLISAFAFRCLASVIALVFIQNFQPVAGMAGFSRQVSNNS